MQNVLEHIAQQSPEIPNWRHVNDVYTTDQLIEAYLFGKKEGVSYQQAILRDKFDSNLTKTVEIANELINFLVDKNLGFEGAMMRFNSVVSFDVAFLIEESVYYGEELDLGYEQSFDAKAQHCSDTYFLNFYFFPKTKSLDLNLMASDGFFIAYDGNDQESTHQPGATK